MQYIIDNCTGRSCPGVACSDSIVDTMPTALLTVEKANGMNMPGYRLSGVETEFLLGHVVASLYVDAIEATFQFPSPSIQSASFSTWLTGLT